MHLLVTGGGRGAAAGDLHLPAHWSARDWIKVLGKIAKKNWNVRIQGAYRHGTGVTTYLSRYVRGGPIKDHRILAEEEGRVMFRYRDHRDGKSKTAGRPVLHGYYGRC